MKNLFRILVLAGVCLAGGAGVSRAACLITGTDSMCAGGYTNLSGPDGYCSYTWTGGPDPAFIATTQQVTLFQPGRYHLVVTDPASCLFSDSCTIVVRLGQVPFCRIIGPQGVCYGNQPFRFYSVASSGSHVNWQTQLCQMVSPADSPWVDVIFPQPNVTAFVYCTAIISGCFSNEVEHDVNVYTGTPVSISGPITACAGETKDYHALTPIGPAGLTYAWQASPGAAILGSATDSIVHVSVLNPPFTMVVTITDGQCSGNINLGVQAGIPPVVTILTQDSVYIGARTTFHGTSDQIASLPPVYHWSITPAATILSAQADSVVVQGVSVGACTLSVSHTGSLGCTTVARRVFQVDSLPQIHVTGPDTVCAQQGGLVYRSFANFDVAVHAWSVTGPGSVQGASDADSVIVTSGAPGSMHVTVTGFLSGFLSAPQPGLRRRLAPLAPTLNSVQDSKTVLVSAPISCQISPTGSFCPGQTVVFTAAVSLPARSTWAVKGPASLVSSSGNSAGVRLNGTGSVTLYDTLDYATCSAVCSLTVNVTAPLACFISGINQLCSGSSSSYAASANLAGASFTWSVTGRGALIGATSGSTTALQAGDFGDLALRLTATAQGCTASSVRTVHILPALQSGVSGPTRLTAGRPQAFTAIPNLDVATFSWRIQSGPGTIQGPANQAAVVVSPSDSGALTLVLTTSNGLCSDIQTRIIPVDPLPFCGIDGPGTACSNGPNLVFTALSRLPQALYEWRVAGSATVVGVTTAPTAEIKPGSGSEFQVTLNVRTQGAVQSCTRAVELYPSPICAHFGPDTLASQDLASYSAPASADYQNASYAWTVSGPGILLGPADGPSVQVAGLSPGIANVFLSVSRGGCSSTCSQRIVVTETPRIRISGPQVCAGDPAATFYGVTSLDHPFYQWQVIGGATPTGVITSNILNVSVSGPFSLFLYVHNSTDTATTIISVNPVAPPVCSITGAAPAPIANTDMNTVGAQVSGSAPFRLHWAVRSPGNDWYIIGDDQLSTLTYHAGASSPATFTLQATDGAGCFGTVSRQVNATIQPAIHLAAVRPSGLARRASRTLHLTGQNFDSSGRISLGAGIQVLSRTFVRADSMLVDVKADSDAALGPRNIQVSNASTSSVLPAAFLVVAPARVTFADPDTAGTGVQVGLHGSGFETAEPDTVWLDQSFVSVITPADTLLSFVIPPDVQAGSHNLSARAWGAPTNSIIFEVLPVIPGDVNGDGRVTVADLAEAAGFIMGRGELLGRARIAADCDNSGFVDVFDLVCMVDAALKPGGRVQPDGLAWRGAAVWNAATRTLVLPEEATAAQWQGVAVAAAAGRNLAGVQRTAVFAGGLYGLAPRTASRSVILPEGVAQVSEVIWGDARGRLFRARVTAPGLPTRFESALNPQHGRLWFLVPAHRGRAALELFDVGGRRLATRELEESETGSLDWAAPGGTPDGLYFVRYSSAEGARNVKILFVR